VPQTADRVLLTGCYSCDNCEMLSVAVKTVNSTRWNEASDIALLEAPEGAVQWIPLKGVGKDYPDVPDVIATAASEVRQCLSINAPRAAVALVRATLEAAAKERGFTVGRLVNKIDAMADAGLIRPDSQAAAHEVRLDGNEVAHGDLVSIPMSVEEATDVADLLDEILRELYQAPAQIARVRTNREARQRGEAASPSGG